LIRKRLHVPAWVVFGLVGFGVVVQWMSLSGIGTTAERLTSRRLLFHLRALVSPPPVSPKLRIFSFDDRTAAGVGDFDLSLRDWADVISAVNAREPHKIYIDKLFDKPHSPENVVYFREQSRLWSKKPSVISFVRDEAIPFRENIQPTHLKGPLNELIEAETVPTTKDQIALVYGAHKTVLEYLGLPGHAVYQGEGFIRAAYPIGEGLFLPHVGLTGAAKIAITPKGVMVDGTKISSSPTKEVPVNFGARDQFKKVNYSLLPLINRVRQGLELTVIEKGDSVLLLPAMYTGNTDWRETPFGSMPGGLIVASVINSQLTGEWVTEVTDPGLMMVLLMVVIFLGGALLPTVLFIYSCSGLGLLWIAAAAGLFIFENTLIPVLWPMVTLAASTAFWVAYHAQRTHTAQTRIRAELDAAAKVQATFIPPETLEEVGFRIRSFSTPASECGGDWWGSSVGADGARYVFIGDAIGHGIPAALVTAVSFAVSETLMMDSNNRTLEQDFSRLIMERLNAVLERLRSDFAQMTFQIVRIDHKAGTMQVMSAAHTFPVIFPGNPGDERLKPGQKSVSVMLRGNFLGSGDLLQAGSTKINIRPGDRIVLYTDGVIENQNLKTAKPFGRQRIVKTGEQHVAASFDDFFAALKGAYFEHVHGTLPADDATLVAIEYPAMGPQVAFPAPDYLQE